MLSGALKENVIEGGASKEVFTKRKRDERNKTWHTGKLQGQFVQGTKGIADELSVKLIKNGFLKKETEGADKHDALHGSPLARLPHRNGHVAAWGLSRIHI